MHPTLRRLAGAALPLVRPYLRLHLLLLGRQVARTPLPRDAPVETVPGPDPGRLLVVGELAASGLGVLLHGMAFPAQLGAAWSRGAHRGCTWRTVARPVLSAAQAAAHPDLDAAAAGTDAAVVALGIPDVLLATRAAAFEDAVERIVDLVRARSSTGCRVVLAGLPPMARFQPVPPLAARLFDLRTRRLDDALRRVADRHEGVAFVPFPRQRLHGLYVRDRFSYRALHRIWAHAVVGALLTVPPSDGPGPSAAPSTGSRAARTGAPRPDGALLALAA